MGGSLIKNHPCGWLFYSVRSVCLLEWLKTAYKTQTINAIIMLHSSALQHQNGILIQV